MVDLYAAKPRYPRIAATAESYNNGIFLVTLHPQRGHSFPDAMNKSSRAASTTCRSLLVVVSVDGAIQSLSTRAWRVCQGTRQLQPHHP